ncbi:MAG: ATP-binding cassette domain-containing protein [Oscillospiraceae bacterium]|nr:ATP-binding cassette domain-containing protein [Oscillospiraceae bacterium]
MQSNDRKVLLSIRDLKQWFPLGKGIYNKANDGISIDIYEGETFGLVGESGCGKSTLGRTILQVYKQTDGRTMYYGESLDELAPEYVRNTIKNLDAKRKDLVKLEEKRDKFIEEYEKLSDEQKIEKTEEFRLVKKQAYDALFDITSIVGGFIVAEDLKPFTYHDIKIIDISRTLHNLNLKLDDKNVVLADVEYTYKDDETKGKDKIEAAKKAVTDTEAEIAEVRKLLAKEHEVLEEMREPLRSDPRFEEYEQWKDDGIDLARLKNEEMRQLRKDLQLIFQDPYSSLNPRMSVGQIIGEGLLAHNFFKKNSPRMQERILKVMDDCGLAPYFVHRYPHQFSGGQRQRIGIARSLATNPKFVVCDEAVSALDVSIQSQIINLLSDLKDQQNLTYLFITHDLSVVKYISDRIGVMYLGNMVELADSQEIFDHPLHPYTEALLGAIPTTDVDQSRELQILEGDIPSPVNPPSGCKFHTRCKYCTDICTKVVPEWQEIRDNHFVACHHLLENNL